VISSRDEGFRRKDDTPRKVRNGIRLRTKDEEVAFSWPAGAWLDRLLAPYGDSARSEGLDFARRGQTVLLNVEPARIVATVQDSAARPFEVRIELESIGREDWDRIVSSMAREAKYTAKLVSGDVSAEIAEPFAAAGLSLLPEPGQVTVKCGCGIEHCRHAVTTLYLVAERMDSDPLMILTLRGLFGPRFLERLQEARLLATSGVSRAHPIPGTAAAIRALPPMEQAIETFWNTGTGLETFRRERRMEYAPHALLRRLGNAPLEGRFPLVGLLASIYDSVAVAARRRLTELDDVAVAVVPPPPDADDDDGEFETHADPGTSDA
jgi:uncharacterized Zn finger protein